MNLQEVITFHQKFKQIYKINPIYTGSLSLFLKGYLDELPNDIDMVLSQKDFDSLSKYSGRELSYEDEEQPHFSFYFLSIKIDAFLDSGYQIETISFCGEEFQIIDPSIAVKAKIKFLQKYVSILEKGESLTQKNHDSFIKHVRHINIYNDRMKKKTKNMKMFYVNGKRVVELKFKDGTILNPDEIKIEEIELVGHDGVEVIETSLADGNISITQGKNIVKNVNIHLGDK